MSTEAFTPPPGVPPRRSVLDAIIDGSVRNRFVVLLLTALFAAVTVWNAQRLVFDAFPDLTNVQVQVLTASPGMDPLEMERGVTMPVERTLSGLPGLVEIRSLSRVGISVVTTIFDDDTDPLRARQLVAERVASVQAELLPAAGQPEVAPPITGLGEVFQFTVTSDRHGPGELHRLVDLGIGPRLRAVSGVVEVTWWGGGAPQISVDVDPFRMAAYDLSLEEVQAAIAGSAGVGSGGHWTHGEERSTVRAFANPSTVSQIEEILVRGEGLDAVRLRDLATVREANALTVGSGTADGAGEALFVVVQLLQGSDARRVAQAVRATLDEVRPTLPEGVEVEPIYDRDKLVSATLRTVARSLTEGGVLVIVILLLFLGNLRAGLVVASVIPLSMLGAFTGLQLVGASGNLMSLGAIDFGLIVDGTIVVVESVVGLQLAQGAPLRPAIAERTRAVARPVLAAAAVLGLAYVPILFLWGVEGRLFRPMALTVLFAVATAMVLAFTWVPAACALFVRPHGERVPWIARAMQSGYAAVLPSALRHPWLLSGAAFAAVAGSLVVGSTLGVEFIPRLEEGDLVVQTGRAPTLTPDVAVRESLRIERALLQFPEVERVATRTGAPGLATDPMGMEESDFLVLLRPADTWRFASTEAMIEAMSDVIDAEAPGAEVGFTQPIDMRFSELLEGIPADVGVGVYGPDLDELQRLADQVAHALESTPGSADVRVPSREEQPGYEVDLNAERLGALGLRAEDVLALVEAVQIGRVVTTVIRDRFPDPVVLRLALPPGVGLSDVPVALPGGGTLPLGAMAQVRTVERPVRIDREDGSRRIVVRANVRGRDVGSFVPEAQQRIRETVTLPPGYRLDWSGKYEQLRTAIFRTLLLVPAVLFLIGFLLRSALGAIGPAALIFLNVPIAVSGGVYSLWLRDLPLSMSAVVGFITLFGIAVMDGIVLLSRTRELHRTVDGREAARLGALERFRPVTVTTLVAGIGFLPMAIATSTGAEVQRPLATVVIGGLLTSTTLTLLVLPALYARFAERLRPEEELDDALL